jgi:hypothetical protein
MQHVQLLQLRIALTVVLRHVEDIPFDRIRPAKAIYTCVAAVAAACK